MVADIRTPPQAPAATALEVLLLGATEVRAHGQPVAAGGALQRGALAMLALAAGRAVSTADLTAGLWGATPPPSAPSTLRAYLSRLRTGPAAGAIVRDAGGYRLDRDRAWCDAAHVAGVRDELDRDDPDALGDALDLWRGQVLADLRHLPFAPAHVQRLEALHTALRDRRLELLVAHGRTTEALPELQTVAAGAPHDQGLAALLMRALASTGRHGDALAVFDDVRRRLRDDLGLDPGPELRELQGAILVHDPAVAGIPATSTPVASPQMAPTGPGGNLPLPLTSFVGRAAELAAVAGLLETARLTTLTGPGGCGKTRLALEAARRLQATTHRPVWVVELAELDRPDLVPTAVARILGVTTTGASTTLDTLVAALHARRALLVLDNCEHVVAEAAHLTAELLSRCAGVQVLATSREPLGVPGEQVLSVGSLPVGTTARPGDAERLLAERAAGHGVDGDDPVVAKLVRRICRSLDGIPLALELAAARCNVLSLAELADRLDDRFAILDHGSRTAQPRHRTLAAAIAWSHDLLSDEERAVFASASIFRGTFELEDLAAVHDVGSAALIGVLGGLVDKSMVATDTRVTGTRRYRLLETLRVFGQQQLDERGRAALADAHLQHLTARAEQAAVRLRTFDDAPAWRWIDATQGDLRIAFDHAVRTGSACAPRLLAALGWYAYRRGVVREGLRWCDRVRPLRDAAGPEVAAGVALTEASLCYLAGDAERLPRAIVDLRAAMAATDDPDARTLGSIYLAYFEAAFGDPADAEAHLRDAIALVATGTPAPWVRAELAMPQAQFLRALGRPLDAVRVLREGQATAAACGHRWAAGSLAWIEAKTRLDLRDPSGAATLLLSTVRSFTAQGDRTSTLAVLHTMAAVGAALERHEDGARLLGAVDALGEQIGYDVRAMDPADAEAHRAAVRFGCSQQEWDRWLDEGRSLSLAAGLNLAERIAATA